MNADALMIYFSINECLQDTVGELLIFDANKLREDCFSISWFVEFSSFLNDLDALIRHSLRDQIAKRVDSSQIINGERLFKCFGDLK